MVQQMCATHQRDEFSNFRVPMKGNRQGIKRDRRIYCDIPKNIVRAGFRGKRNKGLNAQEAVKALGKQRIGGLMAPCHFPNNLPKFFQPIF